MFAKLLFLAVIVICAQGKKRYRCKTEVPSFFDQTNATQKIVGGKKVPSMIPWQVSIRQITLVGEFHYCGGTILDEKTILSAAHCQIKKGDKILAGHVDLNVGKSIFVERVLKNPYKPYNATLVNNDVVVLKLSEALTMGDNVQPACLPMRGYDPPEGSTCYASGWGVRKYEGQNPPKDLRYVGIPLVTLQSCNTSYMGFITENMLCAGHENGGVDACQGDSGGPLVCISNEKPIIAGISSFGIGCGEAEYPGVYARVTSFMRWIRAQMEFMKEA